ncbi:MAG: DNA gyrase inhibitor YacG [Deltaproteobacteria bacterium]|nr:DNA gyrase inhibitor YacG [Deltaproteobacteria bacterium]
MVEERRRPRCPSCKRALADDLPASSPCRPFCSDRCKMVDLAKWLGGDFAIPGEPADVVDDEN